MLQRKQLAKLDRVVTENPLRIVMIAESGELVWEEWYLLVSGRLVLDKKTGKLISR